MRFNRKSIFISTVLIIVLILSLTTITFAADGPKYVFMFIGDGMANAQVTAAEAFQAHKTGKEGQFNLNFTKFPETGMQTTYAANRFITGSAASATALASGAKTNIGYLGLDVQENSKITIAELAKRAGMKVGIVSSVTIDHATPAAYYSHVPDRGMYYEIGLQMSESAFDYFGGGQPRIDKTPAGKPTVIEVMEEKNYITINANENPEEFWELKSTPAFVYQKGFAGGAFKYSIDYEEEDLTLADYTEKGIELLDNPNGFFMMVEAGKIDWAGHANDAVSNIHDTLALDDAVSKALEFYEKHPNETLIIVTGDHECGGLTMGWAGTQYESGFEELTKQKRSYEWFDRYIIREYKNETEYANADLTDLKDDIERFFGLKNWSERESMKLKEAFDRSMMGEKERSENTETYLQYGTYEPLTVTITHLLNQRAGLSWTSYSHTGVPVPVYAKGLNADKFNGFYDNTDIFNKLSEIMNFEVERVAAVQ